MYKLARSLVLLICLAAANLAAVAQDQMIYTDALQNNWQDWSWATVNTSATGTVHSGTRSIAVTMTGQWEALYLAHSSFSTANYNAVTFWIHGGTAGNQRLLVQATSGGGPLTAVVLEPLAAGTWREVTIPLSQLGVIGGMPIDGIWIQDAVGSAKPVFYVDDVKLVAGKTEPPPTGQVTIAVNAAAGRRQIDPRVYGTSFATAAQLQQLRSPLNRHGGNTTTRYNWLLNADSKGFDWYFQSIGEISAEPGEFGDSFIQASKAGGAEPMITIPMIDWVAKLGPNRSKLASFSIAKYGPQTDADWTWFPDAGNGVRTNGQYVTGNDPNDANTPNSVAMQRGWVQHIINKFGSSTNNGVKYYFLDNEYSAWHGTHRDVQPTGIKMGEVFAKMRNYAAMIKEQDPNAIIMGPEEWGWDGYLYSGFDLQWAPSHNWERPDRAANGNMDYVPWLLKQFRQHEQQTGRRLLDVFSLHYYPQGGEYSENVSPEMQLRRNRSTRSLWDPNYIDESWINDRVRLIPRMRQWAAEHYPNTPIALTEYSWGADAHINGATTQADIFGILGREGIDSATRWVTPPTDSPTFKAMKMYRNYDNAGRGFGETSVQTVAPQPDEVSAFASIRSGDGALTIMVVNKVVQQTTATINVANLPLGQSAQVWQLTAANTIDRLADVTVTGGSLVAVLPPQSVTLFVVPQNSIAAPTALTGARFGNMISLSWQDNSADEDEFHVERAPAGSTSYTVIKRMPAGSTAYRANVKHGRFSYRIRAVRAGQASEPTNAVPLGR